ncbi:MAG: helix-turn-helix transcriptional regulator [Chitinophagales bacterium]|nr:helix-turn-helix transcriptional regulator [Chitinophagales bacterium]
MKKGATKRTLIFDEAGLRAFALHLKTIRTQKNITQEDLAYKSGLALSQIARIETARINPTLSTIFTIARTLNIDLKELFDFELPEYSG